MRKYLRVVIDTAETHTPRYHWHREVKLRSIIDFAEYLEETLLCWNIKVLPKCLTFRYKYLREIEAIIENALAYSYLALAQVK